LTSFFKLAIIIAIIIVTVVLMLGVRELVVKCEPVRHELRITTIHLYSATISAVTTWWECCNLQ